MTSSSTEGGQERSIVVIVDTSFICAVPGNQKADWEKLLVLSEEKRIEIHISHISKEEWRTRKRDELISEIAKFRAFYEKFHESWRKNLLSNQFNILLALDSFMNLFPTPEDVEEASNDVILVREEKGRKYTQYKGKGRIFIDLLSPLHMERSWQKYFSWEAPFKDQALDKRHDSKIREGRRQDIPDAWIYESAIDLVDEASTVLCLVNDRRLGEALEDKAQVYNTAREVLDYLDLFSSPQPSIAERSTPSVTPAVEDSRRNTGVPSEQPERLSLNTVLSGLAEQDAMLQIRILGYITYFAPLSKEGLVNYLQQKGHEPAQISNAAERLALKGLIKLTGNNYIPLNNEICRGAAAEMAAEIAQLIGD